MKKCRSCKGQQGATLAIVLIVLLLIVLTTLASIRGATLQELMTGAALDRAKGFQAAEAALREGEEIAETNGNGPPWPSSGCTSGRCGKPDPVALAPWLDESAWAEAPELTVGGPVATNARVIVELLVDDVPPSGSCTTSGDISDGHCHGKEKRFRVTARSRRAGGASVTLQSIYAVP